MLLLKSLTLLRKIRIIYKIYTKCDRFVIKYIIFVFKFKQKKVITSVRFHKLSSGRLKLNIKKKNKKNSLTWTQICEKYFPQ